MNADIWGIATPSERLTVTDVGSELTVICQHQVAAAPLK